MHARTMSGVMMSASLCITLLGSTSDASANATCNKLIADIQSKLSACGNTSNCVALTQDTKNERVGNISRPLAGRYTLLTMRAGTGSLDGTGNTLFSDRFADAAHMQPFDFRQPSLGIFTILFTGPNAGRVSLNNGATLDPVCFFDVFMVVATPFSVDVLTFSLPEESPI